MSSVLHCHILLLTSGCPAASSLALLHGHSLLLPILVWRQCVLVSVPFILRMPIHQGRLPKGAHLLELILDGLDVLVAVEGAKPLGIAVSVL